VADEFARFAALGEELRFLLITLARAGARGGARSPWGGGWATNTGRSGVWILAQASADPKCVRCWHRRPDVGSDARHPQLCATLRRQYRGSGRANEIRMSEAGNGSAPVPQACGRGARPRARPLLCRRRRAVGAGCRWRRQSSWRTS